MDGMALIGADGFGDVVDRHNQVERILSGHLHRPVTRRFRHTVAQTCPSIAVQLELDLRPQEGVGLTKEPILCLLHYWDGDDGLVTHTSYIGDYETRTVFDGKEWKIADNLWEATS